MNNEGAFDPTSGERPYRIGSVLAWDDTVDVRQIELVDSSDFAAVRIAAELMTDIVGEDTSDPVRMAMLIAKHKADIEFSIAVCAIEHWEPDLGIEPIAREPGHSH